MAYEGKEPCQGCGRTGSERFRWSKNQLCPDCQAIFEKGKCLESDSKIKEYVGVRQFMFAFNSLEFRDNTLNRFVPKLLMSLDNPFAECNEFLALKEGFGDNTVCARIPKPLFAPLKEFVNKMDEGVAKGRNLLFQLNNGDITLEEFNQEQKYNKTIE